MAAFNSMYIDAQTSDASELTEAQAIHDAGLIILYNVTALALQTLFYGIYVVLILFSTWVLCQRGLPRANLVMLVTILVMFISSTSGFWVHTVTVLKRIRSLLVEQPGESIAAKLLLIRDSLRGMEGGAFYCSLVNFILGDGIVVWRAMVLQRHKWQRFVLLCLFLCSIVAAGVVGGSQLRYLISPSNLLGRIVVISRCVYWGLSLVINLFCTCLIACTTWNYRKATQLIDRPMPSRVQQILTLLVESAALYSFLWLALIVGEYIRIPGLSSLVTDMFMPTYTHIAGIYPTAIIVLVKINRSPCGSDVSVKTMPHMQYASHGPSAQTGAMHRPPSRPITFSDNDDLGHNKYHPEAVWKPL